MVIHLPPLSQVLRLERNLQAAAAHAERHGIHVDKIIRRRPIADVVVLGPLVQVVVDGGVAPRPGRFFVAEDGHVDLDLAAAAGADVGGQGGETDVRVGDLVRDELRAQLGARGRVVGVREDARAAQPREGGQGDGVLVGEHVVLGDAPPGRDVKTGHTPHST